MRSSDRAMCIEPAHRCFHKNPSAVNPESIASKFSRGRKASESCQTQRLDKGPRVGLREGQMDDQELDLHPDGFHFDVAPDQLLTAKPG